eukprot:TRINITY_DN32532_c0_g1_i1.p1 TRINITY_DN32532_c0_g1~~TRINITY_DN32532_c0_g1_i1.p1  ORF type:complete len:643 (+),score=152.59 TRINITY_DN32532_c0_g1_i1:55-1983(+)
MDSPTTGQRQKRRVYSTASVGAVSVKSAASKVSEFFEDVACITDHSRLDQRTGVMRPVSHVAITFNMLQSAMGTGVLGLAVVFVKSGSLLGSVVTITVGVVAYLSIWLILNAVTLLETHNVASPPPSHARSPNMENQKLSPYAQGYGTVPVAALAVRVEKSSGTLTGASEGHPATPLENRRSCLASPELKMGKSPKKGAPRFQDGTSSCDEPLNLGEATLPIPKATPTALTCSVIDDCKSHDCLDSIRTFEELAMRCFGRPGRMVVQASLIGMCLVAMCAFLVPLKSFLHLIFSNFHWYTDAGGSPNICLLAVLALVVIPLSTLRQVGKLWVSSLMGVVMILFFVIATTAMTITDNVVHVPEHGEICRELTQQHGNYTAELTAMYPSTHRKLINSDFLEILSAMGLVVSSYVCHLTLFPIFEETAAVEGTTVAAQKVKRCSAVAMSIITLIYVVAAWAGYTAWGAQAEKASSTLACYDPTDPLICALYIGICLTAISAFPLALLSCRGTIALMVFKKGNTDTSLPQHLGLTLAIVALVGGVSMVAKTISSVLGVGGAFVSPPLVFLLPAASYLRASNLVETHRAKLLDLSHDIGQDAEADRMRENTLPSFFGKSAAWTILVMGIFVMVGAVFASLYCAFLDE